MPRNIRDFESFIHDGTLKDIIAAHLYATTLVADDEEVLELTVGEPDREGVRPIRYKTIKEKEVELIIHT
jgi:hypothetical protein